MAPAADDTGVARLAESALAQAFCQAVVVRARRDGTDHIHIVGRAGRWCSGVADPEMDACSAEEDHLLEQRAESVRCGLEEVGAHAGSVTAVFLSAACSSSAATWRTRASPALSESMIDRSSASAGLS